MTNKIFITGATGYLGSNFINQYKNNYIFERFSVLNKKLEDVSFYGIDIVMHCAALVHQKAEQPYAKYYDVNVEYPLKIARLAKKSGVKQFVFISTIAVYGGNREMLDERTPCVPITLYGKSKLEAEIELQKLEDNNFKVSIIRPPIVNGYNAPGNMKSLINLVSRVPFLPFWDVQNKRSMVYVGNLCHLIDVIIQKQARGVFLASDDKAISTTKLIELIAKELDKKINLIKVPFFESLLKLLKPSFHKRLYGNLEVDNSETKAVLEFENLYSVEDGIKYMIHGEDNTIF